jgi:hypothetical protein
MRLAGALFLVALRLGAQQTGAVTVTGPDGNPIREGTPRFTIATFGFAPFELPLRVTLQIATQADLSGALLADTTLTGVTAATIVIPRLMPERTSIWWRARVLTSQNRPVLSNVEGPRTTATWLTLVSPNNRNGSTVDTKTPRFVWSSAGILPPVKPWTYHLAITRALDGLPVLFSDGTDSSFTSVVGLESNTPYRWSVTAKLETGDSVKVNSFSTFVILDPNAPIATVLYQPFPNPFPNAFVSKTCIWIDLRALSEVKLDVLDIRGNHVAKLLPGRGLGPFFPANRYGRAAVGSDTGCDDRFTWDGKDDSGRTVPTGVYIIRFRGDGVTSTHKVLWRPQ